MNGPLINSEKKNTHLQRFGFGELLHKKIYLSFGKTEQKAMSRILEERPSFFKVLCRTDFNHLLRLPGKFTEKYGSFLQKKVKLRMESGRTWDVKVEAVDDGLFCFSRGWNKFAQDVGLTFWGVLIFMLDDDGFTFDVSVYESNGCQKEFPEDSDDGEEDIKIMNQNARVESKPDGANKRRRSKDGEKTSWEKSSPLYFEIDFKPHHRSRLSLAKTFWVAAGLSGKQSVGLEFVANHHYQSVELDRKQYRIDIGTGWHQFRSANGLVVGRRYSFEYKPSKNVILVKEVSNGIMGIMHPSIYDF